MAFIRKEPCLTFTLNRFFQWKIIFHMSAQKILVLCVSTMAASLTDLCIYDLKDVFMNWPGSACFQAKGGTRNKFLFDSSKLLFFLPLKQPTSKLQRRRLSVV